MDGFGGENEAESGNGGGGCGGLGEEEGGCQSEEECQAFHGDKKCVLSFSRGRGGGQ